MKNKYFYIKLLIKILFNKRFDWIQCFSCGKLIDPTPYCSDDCANTHNRCISKEPK